MHEPPCVECGEPGYGFTEVNGPSMWYCVEHWPDVARYDSALRPEEWLCEVCSKPGSGIEGIEGDTVHVLCYACGKAAQARALGELL